MPGHAAHDLPGLICWCHICLHPTLLFSFAAEAPLLSTHRPAVMRLAWWRPPVTKSSTPCHPQLCDQILNSVLESTSQRMTRNPTLIDLAIIPTVQPAHPIVFLVSQSHLRMPAPTYGLMPSAGETQQLGQTAKYRRPGLQ